MPPVNSFGAWEGAQKRAMQNDAYSIKIKPRFTGRGVGSFFFFLSHFYFPASGQAVVKGVVPPPPRYLPSFLSRIGFSIPTARRFSSNVANSRSRAFAKTSQSVHQQKVPTNLCEYALGGTRTHAIDL